MGFAQACPNYNELTTFLTLALILPIVFMSSSFNWSFVNGSVETQIYKQQKHGVAVLKMQDKLLVLTQRKLLFCSVFSFSTIAKQMV